MIYTELLSKEGHDWRCCGKANLTSGAESITVKREMQRGWFGAYPGG